MININRALAIFLSSLILISLPISNGIVLKDSKKVETFKSRVIIYTVFYLDNRSIKTIKYVDIEDAFLIADELNSTANLLEKQFEVLRRNELVKADISLESLEEKYRSFKKVNIENLMDLIREKFQLPSNILTSKENPFNKIKLVAYGSFGKMGFTTRLPLYGRFGQPLPGLSIVIGTHSLLPGLGVDLSLLNLGVFLGDFSSSISGRGYAGVGLWGLTIGFMGWMTFIIFPGVYTYIWATGYYGFNIWFGLFFDKSS